MTGRAIAWEPIAADLRRGIADGTWQPGQLLPSIRDLCVSYGVSNKPVRRAVEQLVAEGLAVAEHGRGTRVTIPTAAADTAATPPVDLAQRVAELEQRLSAHVADSHRHGSAN